MARASWKNDPSETSAIFSMLTCTGAIEEGEDSSVTYEQGIDPFGCGGFYYMPGYRPYRHISRRLISGAQDPKATMVSEAGQPHIVSIGVRT